MFSGDRPMLKSWMWTGLALLLTAAGSYILYLALQPSPLPAQLLYGNGHVEATDIQVAAEIGGRVTGNDLVEGKSVKAGALLVKIDDTELILRKQRANAEIETLRRNRERVERQLQVARHHAKTGERDVLRYRELRQRNAIPQQQLDQAEDAFREKQGQVAVLEAEIATIDGRIEAATQDLKLIENQIEKTRITAPIAGTVLAKAVEVGEFVQPGQTVAVLADLTRPELKVFVPEIDIGKIKLGAPVRVRVDAFPEHLIEGRVQRVDQRAQFTPRDIHMPQERTRMVFGVTLALDNDDGFLKPGMPADAWILWRTNSEWPEHLSIPE